ncbi:hypothetical protein [Kitasatospora purpeofusca]|uniref:hypothetical protein n=1 Tax=Kitasatospora purpeofusca TaxID=67352 RepID=UPI0035DAC9B6
MTPDRRNLSLPAFSEPAAEAPVPAQAGGRRLPPIEQGADFREPPAGSIPAPVSVRHPLATGLTFSDPGQQS